VFYVEQQQNEEEKKRSVQVLYSYYLPSINFLF